MAEKLEIIITAKDQTKGVFNNISGSLGKIGKFAAGAAVAGIAAAGTAVAGLGAGLVALTKDAVGLQGIEDAFKSIADASGKSSDEILKAFQEQSKGMITNTELMKTYNLAASLVSDQFANELPDAMGYLGKVSAATGEDMGFLMDSLVRGVGRLSPMILDNLGIQVDLNEAYETYAQELGKSADELTKTEQQTALMNQVMEKLAENTADMPDFSDPFKQLSTTFTNLKDTIAKAVGPVILPLIQELADGISAFVSSDEFQAWLENAVKWLRDEFIPVVRDVVTWLSENLPPAIEFLSNAWKTVLKPALEAIWDFLKTKVIPAIQTLYDWLKVKIPEAVQFVRNVLDGLKTMINNVRNAIQRIVEWIRKWVQRFKDLIAVLPDWLIPGSPTPFELGIRGISNAMREVARQGLPTLTTELTATGTFPNVPATTGGSGATNVYLTYAPGFSLASREELETRLMPIIQRAVR